MNNSQIIEQAKKDIKNLNFYEAEKLIRSLYGEYPSRPVKPHLGKNPDSKMARDYANQMDDYEKALPEWKEKSNNYRYFVSSLDDILINHMKDLSGLNTIVPEKYRAKVYSHAYNTGHSSGYSEVFHDLNELVEIFSL